MEYFVIITLELPGGAAFTNSMVVTVKADATMQDVYEHARAQSGLQAQPGLPRVRVTYFGAWPNQLT